MKTPLTKPERMHTILVVDDDPEELAAACRALGACYPVLAATSGEDALRTARSSRPSVIVLDVMMAGGRDGFAVFRQLRDDPRTRLIPVVFLTHVNQSANLHFGASDMTRYLGGKPAAFLEKPVSPAGLLQTVARAMDRPTPDNQQVVLCQNP